MTAEEWRPSRGAYEVSSLGRVRRGELVLKQRIERGKRGERYLRVDLSIEGVETTVRVHQLVAEAFHPRPDRVAIVNHKDGDKRHNAATNLEWSTKSHNAEHALALGLLKTKARAEDIAEMRRLAWIGLLPRQIGKRFGVGVRAVQRIVARTAWVGVKTEAT